jgi:putative colanic acid biosynthesis acetyltransferase WcaF
MRFPRMAEPSTPITPIFQRLDTTARFPYSAGEYARRALWEVVQATCIRWSFRRAEGWRRFWLRMFGARISRTCKIKPTTRIRHPWLLSLGEFSVLAEDVDVYNLGPVDIGDHTVVSHRATLCAGTHDHTQPNLPLQRPPIRIGHGVWICTQAFIGPGVTVGDNCVIASCAVVTKDAPPGMILAGNPARVVKARPHGGTCPHDAE